MSHLSAITLFHKLHSHQYFTFYLILHYHKFRMIIAHIPYRHNNYCYYNIVALFLMIYMKDILYNYYNKLIILSYLTDSYVIIIIIIANGKKCIFSNLKFYCMTV